MDSILLDVTINHYLISRVFMILLMCITSGSVIAQNVNLDTLTIDELNRYKDKAVKLRNTGAALTLGGIGVGATGFFVAVLYSELQEDKSGWGLDLSGVGILFISGLTGITMTLIGTPIWITGYSRKVKAELKLQTFNIIPENSRAVGLGLTLRF